MALRFFRRRQKLVIGLMVLLMVAFLVPTGIRGCFQRDPSEEPIGSVGKEKITFGMRRAADLDLRLLRDWLRLGGFNPPRRGEMGFATFLRLRHDPFLTWALLVHEAREMGIRIPETKVEEFLAASGLERDGGAYREMLASLLTIGLTETQLRRAVANYLLVTEASEAGALQTWPSLPELRQAFRDLNERLKLAMVTFPAEDFVKDVEAPSDQKVREWFGKHRHLIADHPSNRTEYGFGYYVLNQLDIAYLFVNSERVEQAVEPSEDEMLEYWQRNRGRMTKRVRIPAPAPPATTSRPATGPTSAAATQATQPAEPKFRDVVIQRYSEAKPDIREVLKGKAAEDKMSALLRQAEELIDQYGADEGAYSKAAAAMIRPADALLGKMIARIPFRKAPLASIIEHLQDVTGVKIVYPFGRHGTWFLDETVAVEIDPKWGELSLGELLAKLSAAHGYPKFQWVTCAGFESVIFPSAPVDLVPLSSGRTGMVGPEEIVEHELLGAAVLTKEPTGSAQTLASIASTAEELQGPELRRTPLVKVGGDFRPAMYVSGDRPGRLLWRLVKAEAAHTPQQLTPEIRRQVVADLKTVEALKKAEAAAEAMKTKLDAGGRVAELSKQQDREVVDTELLARNTDYFGQIAYTSFPGVGASREFIEKAFELVPDDPEPPHAGTPAAVIPLRRKHEVVLAQRVGYEPAVESEFREGALALVRTLLIQRRRTTLFSWFSGPAVARRVGFVERLPEK